MRSDSAEAGEWRLGWTLVLASMVGFSFHSIMAQAAGIFIQPLTQEFGWSRAQASSGVTIASVVAAILSPFFGVLIDRVGTRRIALPGLLLTSGVIAAFATLNGSSIQWFSLWVVYSLVSRGVKSTVWTAAVAGVFDKGRGLAIGLTLSGSAVAQIFVPPVCNLLIEQFGWRGAFVWTAVGWGSLAFLLAWLFLYDAVDRRRSSAGQAGAAEANAHARAAQAALPGLNVSEAWRDPALWRIALSTLIMMILTIALMVHQFPLLTEAGVSRGDAALLASLGGIAGIAGKLITGWLLDRWRANWVGGITLGSTAIVFVLLLEPFRTPALIVVAMVINGYASGTKLQICGYLTTRYGGMRNFGTIFGFMASVIALGSGLGPLIGGLVYDWYGNYTPFLITGFFGCLVSAWLIIGLPPYPDWKARGAE